MARDLNRLFDDLRRSRQVYVTPDGTVEDATEADENREREMRTEGQPAQRTRLKPEVFGRRPILHVFADVLSTMHAESLKHDVETGGIVVGPDERTITELIASGPAARRTAASYELDVEHLQPVLATVVVRRRMLDEIDEDKTVRIGRMNCENRAGGE